MHMQPQWLQFIPMISINILEEGVPGLVNIQKTIEHGP